MTRTDSRQFIPSSLFARRSKLYSKIRAGDFKIAIYGLGHVGAPMASVWLRFGAHVIGVDKSANVLENARKGITHLPEPGVNEALTIGLKEKRFKVIEKAAEASTESDLKMICVPVLAQDGKADLTAVKDVSLSIASGLKRGDVVTLNPTVPPGTTEEVMIPILEHQNASSLKVEEDFYVLYNPERIYEGRAIEDIENRYPAILAGAGQKSLEIGDRLYTLIFKRGVIKMSNIRTAEIEKLLEGVYRDVNIALANELAKLCESLGVNFWEAREAANSQPFCQIHKAGIGVGGACIPVYPQFILQVADSVNVKCKLTEIGRTINNSMPRYGVRQAVDLLRSRETRTNSSRRAVVTLLGLAFRGGVSDTRFSPTYDVIRELKKFEFGEIRVHDPLVKRDPLLENSDNIILFADIKKSLSGADLVIIVADHPEYRDLDSEMLRNAVVYDGRGIISANQNPVTRLLTIGDGSNPMRKRIESANI
jgi:UDP-N-acetyl-D-glucosamine dehydrogenase